MRLSVSGPDRRDARRESRGRTVLRHAAVIWLLVVQPILLALALDRALPRLGTFGAAAWTVVAVHVVLICAGIAIARRLRAAEADAWRAVALWACAAVAATVLERGWPVFATSLAPSEARLAAYAAVARDVVIAGVAAWLARADTAVAGDRAQAGDSS